MPVNMPSKHGNWVHLHQHPCISGKETLRVAFCGAFFVSLGPIRKPASRAGDFDLRGN